MPKSNTSEDSYWQRQNSKNQEPPSPSIILKNINLSLNEDFPVSIDFQSQIRQFITNGVLKNMEHQALEDKVLASLEFQRVAKLCRIVLEIVIVTKYPQSMQSPQLLSFLKQKASKTYVKLFSQLPSPKDEVVNYIIFTIAYNIHWALWRIAKDEREEMDMRFVFDVYHIVIFTLNGLYVSDSYVRHSIEKIFSMAKFMDYEREKKEKIRQKNLEKKKQQNQKTFLGRQLHFPNIGDTDDGLKFQKELNDRMQIKRQTSEDIQQQRAETKYNLQNSLNQPENKSTQQDFQENGEGRILLQNLQLNVNQISPCVYQVLQMNKQQLPFSRKKMLSHTFEKYDDKADGILRLLKQMTQQRKQKKDLKQTKKYQRSLIELYDLRAPGKEYYQKMNPKVDDFFKDMLELNYVLENHQESLHTLYSMQELNKPQDYLDQPITVLAQMSPQKRLMHYLQTKLDTQMETKETLKTSASDTLTTQQKLSLFPPIQEPENMGQSKAGQQNSQSERYKDFNIKQNLKKKMQKEEPIYVEKKQQYKQKYDGILKGESTDSKINHIVQNIQSKQHLVAKNLTKRIHRF